MGCPVLYHCCCTLLLVWLRLVIPVLGSSGSQDCKYRSKVSTGSVWELVSYTDVVVSSVGDLACLGSDRELVAGLVLDWVTGRSFL